MGLQWRNEAEGMTCKTWAILNVHYYDMELILGRDLAKCGKQWQTTT